MAIGHRTRDGLGRNDAAAARLVVDHDGLSQELAHVLCEHPRERVRGAAGGRGHHELDGSGRIGLRLRLDNGVSTGQCSDEAAQDQGAPAAALPLA